MYRARIEKECRNTWKILGGALEKSHIMLRNNMLFENNDFLKLKKKKLKARTWQQSCKH